MKKKGLMRAAVAVFLCFLLATQALAAVPIDISQGDLVIKKGDADNREGYLVTGFTDQYVIIVEDGVTTTITLNGVIIHGGDRSAIDIGKSDVTLDLEGTNTVTSEQEAAIHVSDGDLTITSDSEGELTATNELDWGTCAAAIGSSEGEDFTGSVTIEGDAYVDVTSDSDGAGIGSGEEGDMSGTITIKGDAYVEAESDSDGAGIGSGQYGEMSGTITIEGDAYVDVLSDDDGAGIGSGQYGEMSGEIIIQDGADVDAYAEESGAGIGSGSDAEMSGTVIITDEAEVYAVSEGDGAGIGSGNDGDMSGDIVIDGDTSVGAYTSNTYEDEYGTAAAIGSGGVGTGYYNEYGEWVDAYVPGGEMSGTITIGGTADVDAQAEGSGAGIGSAEGGEMSGKVTIEDEAYVYADSELSGAGIGSGAAGDMSGEIHITDDAEVDASSCDCYGEGDGAGIGSGSAYYGHYDEYGDWVHEFVPNEMSGKITIDGNAYVYGWSYYDGAGIGSGYCSEMSGTITIGGEAYVNAGSTDYGAGIGSGDCGEMSGDIIITDDAYVEASSASGGAGVGSGDEGAMSGRVAITGNAAVDTEVTNTEGIGPGSNMGNEESALYVIGENVVINGATGEDALLHVYADGAELIIGEALPGMEGEVAAAWYAVFNEKQDVWVLTAVNPGSTALVESELSAESAAALTDEGENVLRACTLEFAGGVQPVESFILCFDLGDEWAGKEVEIRMIRDGEVVTETVIVGTGGVAAIVVDELGDFAVVAK